MALDTGSLVHWLTLERPGATTPDGDGGYTQTWESLNPSRAWASIEAATQRALERLVSNTVTVQATHIVRMPYHPDLDETCRISWVDRARRTHTANVTDVTDVDQIGEELIVLCVEPPV